MIACHGRIQREGEVVHVVTDRLEDLSDLLRGVGERDEPAHSRFPLSDDLHRTRGCSLPKFLRQDQAAWFGRKPLVRPAARCAES